MKTYVRDIAKQISNLSETEIEELARILSNTYGMSATIYHYPIGIVPTAMGIHDEQVEFDVIMTRVGHSKLRVVKAVKELLDIGLRDAKAITDAYPVTIKEFASKQEAENIRIALEAAGATIEVK